MALYQVSGPPAAADINQYVNLLSGNYPGGDITIANRVSAGLTGATAANGFVGAITGPGNPTSGTFAVGDWAVGMSTVASPGPRMYVCTAAGSPGTWVANGGLDLSTDSSFGNTSPQLTARTGRTGFDILAMDQSSNSAVFSVSLHGFVITRAGFYVLDSGALLNTPTLNIDHAMMLILNGSILAFGPQFTGYQSPAHDWGGIYYFNVNDQVQLGVYSEDGGGIFFQSAGMTITFLGG